MYPAFLFPPSIYELQQPCVVLRKRKMGFPYADVLMKLSFYYHCSVKRFDSLVFFVAFDIIPVISLRQFRY